MSIGIGEVTKYGIFHLAIGFGSDLQKIVRIASTKPLDNLNIKNCISNNVYNIASVAMASTGESQYNVNGEEFE